MKNRLPKQINFGQFINGEIGSILLRYKVFGHEPNTIMGFKIPDFQRPLVWTLQQKIKLIESLILGIPIGSYSITQNCDNVELDGLLIDGQQRMSAIQSFIKDEFKVFDLYYSDFNEIEKRFFKSLKFSCYITNSTDMDYLKNYYNLMNFGGTSHKGNDYAV